jgi:hypothetical protein
MIPTPGRSLAEIREAWSRVRSELARYLTTQHDGNGERVVFRHPVAGRMTFAQTLTLIRAHFEDHVRQVAQTVDELTHISPSSSIDCRTATREARRG